MTQPTQTQKPKPLVVVTGSQQPYIFDLPHLLSLPKGFEFRFRYRHSWIEDGLRKDIEFPDRVAGRRVLILYHSQESRRILPIRQGEIISIEKLGHMVLVRFRVGFFSKIELDLERYKYPKDPESPDPIAAVAAGVLSSRSKEILGPIDGKEDFNLADALPSGWYLRVSKTFDDAKHWDSGDVPTAWARTIAVLQNEKNLFGIPFFHVLGFRDEEGRIVEPRAIANRFSTSREPIHGFALQQSERYRMRVLEWCERPMSAPAPRIRINCDFDKTLLALEGASNLVVGRYDVIEHTFFAQRTGFGELSLRADSLDKPIAANTTAATNGDETNKSTEMASPPAAESPRWAWSDWPAIFVARVPIAVKMKGRRLLVGIVALAIGVTFYVWVAPQVVDTWRRFVELFALSWIFLAARQFAEQVERFFKLEGATQKLRGEAPRAGND